MTEQRTGKATAELFEQVILRRLGARDADVLVGPRHGVDVGVVRVAEGVAMALTADPVFVVPAYGWERAAWFAVHILASDAATSGLPLRWMAVDLNLPPEITDEELTALWDAFHRACEGIGVAIVTGSHGPLRRLHVADGGRRRLHGVGARGPVRDADDGPARRPGGRDEGRGHRGDRAVRRDVPGATREGGGATTS